MEIMTELTGRTIEQIQEARALVIAGDLAPVKELLYDSALLLHGAALATVKTSNALGHPARNLGTVLQAVEACQQIFKTLAEHSDTNRLSSIAGELFQANLERIMNYIARKGGKIFRYELLTSRVIQGNAIEYDKHLATLVDAGYLAEIKTGTKKDTAYFMVTPNEPPMIEA